jgi:hypothetical protein
LSFDEKEKILVGKPDGKRSYGKFGADGRIILKLILKKQDMSVWNSVGLL